MKQCSQALCTDARGRDAESERFTHKTSHPGTRMRTWASSKSELLWPKERLARAVAGTMAGGMRGAAASTDATMPFGTLSSRLRFARCSSWAALAPGGLAGRVASGDSAAPSASDSAPNGAPKPSSLQLSNGSERRQ